MQGREDGDFFAESRTGVAAGLVLLCLVAVMAVMVAAHVEAPPLWFRLDAWWRDLVQPPASWAHDASRVLYVLGSGWVMVPVRLVVAAWLALSRRWRDLAFWLGAWLAADAVTFALKHGVGRMRPDLADATSFPSAHAKTAAQVAFGAVLLLTSPRRPRAWAWGAAAVWVLLMSVSRTVLDQHWASDVLAGSMIGLGVVLVLAALVQRASERP